MSYEPKRCGLPANIPAEDLKKIMSYSSNENFLVYGDTSLLDSRTKQLIESGLFTNKSFSKRTDSAVVTGLISQIYDGKIYTNNKWIDQISVLNDQKITLRYASNLFYKTGELPFSDEIRSGVYIDEKWSGFTDKSWDNSKVLGGFIISGIDSTGDFPSGDGNRFKFKPYKNFDEIFEHRDIQVGKMGDGAFLEGGYVPGQDIGYNEIYFKSGLNPNNILDKNPQFLYIPNPIYATVKRNAEIQEQSNAVSIGKNFPVPSQEKQNVVRYHVFIYTGRLNYKVSPITPFIDAKADNFAGTKIQRNTFYRQGLSNPTRARVMRSSGIYPEIFSQTFSILNTGLRNEIYYVSTSNENIKIEDSPTDRINISYKWTDESGVHLPKYNPGTNIDNLYILGRNGSKNINFKIDTSLFGVGSFTGERIWVHRAKGRKNLHNQQWEMFSGNLHLAQLRDDLRASDRISGFMVDTQEIVIDTTILNNNSSVTDDLYFFETKTGQNFNRVGLKDKPLVFDSNGIFNKRNDVFGITLYSTGSNIWGTDFRTSKDLWDKINRLGDYSNTGIFRNMREIYPLSGAECYASVYSAPEWIKIKNDRLAFKWLSGYVGLFKNPPVISADPFNTVVHNPPAIAYSPAYNAFNPSTGALQADLFFSINQENFLPRARNISGSNLIVHINNNNNVKVNNFNLTQSNLDGASFSLKRGVEYRFLQVNKTNTHKFSILERGFIQNYKVYAPEYNDLTGFNYRLNTFRLDDSSPNKLTWIVSSGESITASGDFNVVGSDGQGYYRYVRSVPNNTDIYLLRPYYVFRKTPGGGLDAPIIQDKRIRVFFNQNSTLNNIDNPTIRLSNSGNYKFYLDRSKVVTGQNLLRFFKADSQGQLQPFSFPDQTVSHVFLSNISGREEWRQSVSFSTNPSLNINDSYYYGFEDNSSFGSLKLYNTEYTNDLFPTGDYNFTSAAMEGVNLPNPVFSGNIDLITSDVTNIPYRIPVIISGLGALDYCQHLTNPTPGSNGYAVIQNPMWNGSTNLDLSLNGTRQKVISTYSNANMPVYFSSATPNTLAVRQLTGTNGTLINTAVISGRASGLGMLVVTSPAISGWLQSFKNIPLAIT